MRVIAVHTNMGGSVGSLLMQDLAIVLGGKMYNTLDQFFDSSSVYVSDEKIVLGTHRSTVKLSVDGQARAQARVEELQKEVDHYQLGEKFSPKAKFTERRIRDLSGSLVTIFVGGETQSDIKERIDRFEDVVKAGRSALENGVLPGVGIALIHAFNKVLEDGGEGLLDKKDFAIIRGLTEIVHAQHVYLMISVIADSRRTLNSEGVMLQASKDVQDQLYDLQFAQTGTTNGDVRTRPFLALNLSTGKVGTPEDLGIYDTAYASITALRGGFQTAKILASSSSLLLGNKLGGVRI
jgi:chaperonin GroEL (HSP60 family)